LFLVFGAPEDPRICGFRPYDDLGPAASLEQLLGSSDVDPECLSSRLRVSAGPSLLELVGDVALHDADLNPLHGLADRLGHLAIAVLSDRVAAADHDRDQGRAREETERGRPPTGTEAGLKAGEQRQVHDEDDEGQKRRAPHLHHLAEGRIVVQHEAERVLEQVGNDPIEAGVQKRRQQAVDWSQRRGFPVHQPTEDGCEGDELQLVDRGVQHHRHETRGGGDLQVPGHGVGHPEAAAESQQKAEPETLDSGFLPRSAFLEGEKPRNETDPDRAMQLERGMRDHDERSR
jgi:hypothetical protein